MQDNQLAIVRVLSKS